MPESYRFRSTVYAWSSEGSTTWFFIDVPDAESDALTARPQPTRGFGSIRVRVTIGSTTWQTSVFPGKARYGLPLKKAVRVAEQLAEGDHVDVVLEPVD